MIPDWLRWVRQMQAIAQTGLAYGKDPYDIERFEQLRALAAEIAAAHSSADTAAILDLFRGQVGHATPKVDVRGAVFRDDSILLVRENMDAGRWTLPGGWADMGESAGEAVVREVWEESGYEVRAVRLLAAWDRDKHPHPPHPFTIYKLVFQCEITGGEATPSSETSEVAFFRQDALPELSLARVLPGQIVRLFTLYGHPGWPTDFD